MTGSKNSAWLEKRRHVLEIERQTKPLRTLSDVIAEARAAHIVKVLEACRWNVTEAARHLGIDRITVHQYITLYGIKRPDRASRQRLRSKEQMERKKQEKK